MKIKELLRYFDPNQKIIICKSWHDQIYKGLARQANPHEAFNDYEVDFIYLDNNLYEKEYIKIKVKCN